MLSMIDSLGAAFIDRIEGDPSTVVGVSVPALRRMANELGVFGLNSGTTRAL